MSTVESKALEETAQGMRDSVVRTEGKDQEVVVVDASTKDLESKRVKNTTLGELGAGFAGGLCWSGGYIFGAACFYALYKAFVNPTPTP